MAAVAAFAVLEVVAMHVGRAVANVFAGHGWEMTARADLFSSLPRVVAGDASEGLAADSVHVATDVQLWVWMGVSGSLVVLVAVLAFRWWAIRWGPGRILGMATVNEVEQLLGRSRLRRNARVIRPDLYGPEVSR